MSEFLNRLFQPDFMPHGRCWAWDPWVVWSNALSDILIAGSYLLISLTLIYLIRKRRDVAFDWMVLMFGAFIFLCGATHAMEVYNTWHAQFRLAGVLKIITAGVSFATALLLIRISPLMLALPSLDQMRALNETLTLEVEERRRAELELKEIQEDLEARVEVRTRQVREANAELEQFAYVASHDLQEPLRMVSSFTQLLAQRYSGKLDPEADEYIQFAVQGAKNMQQLIHDLLVFARLGAEAQPPEITPLRGLVDQALENLRVSLEESGGQVQIGPLPSIPLDPVQGVQVFQNLIGNALKYRSTAPLIIRVEAQLQGPDWVIRISDNGIGLDLQYADQIFKLFQRLHPKGEYPGSGMGLSICKKILERHGGRIWVEASTRAGSTFAFSLPRERRLVL